MSHPQIAARMLHDGSVVQVVYDYISTWISSTVLMTDTDTPPTITQGTEITSVIITPKSASNLLWIQARTLGYNTTAQTQQIAVFKDAITNAVAASQHYSWGAGGSIVNTLNHFMVAGSTSPITFSLRAGAMGTGVMAVNGSSGGAVGGGTMKSGIHITEIQS